MNTSTPVTATGKGRWLDSPIYRGLLAHHNCRVKQIARFGYRDDILVRRAKCEAAHKEYRKGYLKLRVALRFQIRKLDFRINWLSVSLVRRRGMMLQKFSQYFERSYNRMMAEKAGKTETLTETKP